MKKILILLLFGLNFWFLQTAAENNDIYLPDIDVFMQIGGAGQPNVSPVDGAVFFISSMSGEPQLYRINEKGWPYRLTFFPDGIENYVISPDGSAIIVSASQGGNELHQLYLMNPISGQIKPLTQNPDAIFGAVLWSPDSKSIYYYSTEANGRDFYVYRMDIETGQSMLIKKMEGLNYPQDITPDGRWLLIESCPSNFNTRLYLFDLLNKKTKEIATHKGDFLYINGKFAPDGNSIWIISNQNEKELKKVARYDIKKNKLFFLNPDSPWETEDIDLSLDGRYLAWIANEDGYGVLHITDLRSGEKLPTPSLSGLVFNPTITTDNRIIFSFTSATRAPDVWIWDWQTQTIEKKTFASYAGINPEKFVDPTLVYYQSFDELTIPAFLYLPPNYKGGPIPFLIHAHGGPEGQFRPLFQRHFQYLLLHGFGIFAPNIRGSEGYGKDYMALDNHRKRLDSIKDYKAAADWLINQGYTKKGLLAVKGESYGGYVTLASITEYPEYWDAAVSTVGISNFKTFLLNTSDYRRSVREAEYGPLSDSIWLESISPISKVDRIISSLLLVHGENDSRVPVAEARQIFHAIKERGGVVDTLIFTDEGHVIAKRENNIIYYRKMVEFFKENLKD